MMRVIKLAAVIFLLVGDSIGRAAEPNILFVLTDDQAPWAIGVSGNPLAKTPHMDRLAKEGVYLPNAYTVTPVCSPSRAALMTSRYGSELGITDWIHPRNEPNLGLDPKIPVWPKILQQAGYKTGLVGKWHLGLLDSQHPTVFGFDYFMGHRAGGWQTANPVLEKDGENQKFEGLNADILADEAIEFLTSNRNEKFLLCWHTRAPHTRWLPVADEDIAPYENLKIEIPNPDYPNLDTERVKRMTKEYFASVRSVDRNLGRVLKTLDDLELTNNTIVIFSSDHGYNMGHNGIWHKGNGHWVLTSPPPATDNIPRGQRPNMYDNSIKVPTIIRWPGVLRSGSVDESTYSNLDWFPTILAMAGIELDPEILIRGRNMVPQLLGKRKLDWNNSYYAEYSTKHQSQTDMRMISNGKWKLIRDFNNSGRDELYNLVKDPAESNNLIKQQDKRTQLVRFYLEREMLTRMKSIDDDVHR
ncbi:MAG: N-acetylgalactosamine 6-sulfate sulfatase [Planctomycetaceae bacterium]|nr:N-acetylgalactosamine 6-sulfate sulfatase [Planctomycetaceae bacterium]|tara:strand:+ start:2083 stop:3495 length:1413 start_codon:yes stop_codon:yes gene_type:complete